MSIFDELESQYNETDNGYGTMLQKAPLEQ